jgi:hypothetical protein
MFGVRSGKSIEPALLGAALFAFGFGWLQQDFADWAKNMAGGMLLLAAAHLVFVVIIVMLLTRGVRQLVKFPDKVAGAFLVSLSLYLTVVNTTMLIGYMVAALK